MNPFVETMVYIVAFANIIGMIHLGFFVTGANIYDLKAMRKRRLAAKSSKHQENPEYPLVSVVIPAHNEERGIVRTLDSLMRTSYPNMEIVVVNDGSADQTARIVHDYIARRAGRQTLSYVARTGRTGRLVRRFLRSQRTTFPIKLVSQRNAGKASAVNNGIINHSSGSLVMTLDADSIVQPWAVANAVAYFKDQRVIGVAANVRVMGGGWLGMLQRFEHMVGYRSKKFYTLTNCEFVVGGVASTYRRSTLEQVGYYDTDTQTEDIGLSMKLVAQLGNRDKRIIYASDVVAMTEGVQTYSALIRQRYRWKLGSLQNLFKYRDIIAHDSKAHSRMLTLYRLPMALIGELLLLLEPLMLTYLMYLSISRHNVGIFVGAYLTITLYVLWTIWPDEHMSVGQKFKMSLNALGIYILFYAMTLVQLFAIYKCLRNYRRIYDLSSQEGTWVSPARALAPQVAV